MPSIRTDPQNRVRKMPSNQDIFVAEIKPPTTQAQVTPFAAQAASSNFTTTSAPPTENFADNTIPTVVEGAAASKTNQT